MSDTKASGSDGQNPNNVNLSEEMQANLKEAFQVFDTSGDGSIDA